MQKRLSLIILAMLVMLSFVCTSCSQEQAFAIQHEIGEEYTIYNGKACVTLDAENERFVYQVYDCSETVDDWKPFYFCYTTTKNSSGSPNFKNCQLNEETGFDFYYENGDSVVFYPNVAQNGIDMTIGQFKGNQTIYVDFSKTNSIVKNKILNGETSQIFSGVKINF